MKKNILNVLLALCIVSFSTVAVAQSKSAKPKTSTAKPKAKVREVAPPPPPPPMEERGYDSPPPAMEERVAPPPPPDYSPNEIGRREEPIPMTAPEAPQEPPMAYYPEGEPDEVFQVVEQQAEFPGGQASLFNWLGANMKYPDEARKNKIQGKVILRFIIEKNGSVTGVRVLRGTNDLLDTEAVRVVKSMPNWKAGKQRGNDVRSYFTLPVVFKLDDTINAKADDKN